MPPAYLRAPPTASTASTAIYSNASCNGPAALTRTEAVALARRRAGGNRFYHCGGCGGWHAGQQPMNIRQVKQMGGSS